MRLAAALLALAGCSLAEPKDADPPPELILGGVHLRSYQGDRPSATGTAERLDYQRISGDFTAHEARLNVLGADAGTLIQAPRFKGNLAGKVADAVGGVTLRSTAGLTGHTPSAHLDGHTRTAVGAEPVHVDGQSYTVDARDFVFSFPDQSFHFADGTVTRWIR